MLGSSVFGGRLDGAQRVDVWSNSWGSTRLSASSGKVVVSLLTIFRLMDARRVLYLFSPRTRSFTHLEVELSRCNFGSAQETI